MAVQLDRSLKKGRKAAKSNGAAAAADPDSDVFMLGNGCQRFLAPGGTLYLAGKRYRAAGKKRVELENYADENGVQYLYPATIILRQMEAARRKAERQARIDEGGSGEEDEGEIDTGTGAVTLEDDRGRRVGTKEDNVAV